MSDDQKKKGGRPKEQQFRRVNAKNPLSASVKSSASAPDPKQAAQRADATVQQRLSGTFLEDLDRMVGELRKLPGADGSTPDETSIGQAYHLAHELRGQSGSFGYPLASRIADSLCKVLENEALPARTRGQLMQLHVQALERVRHERLSGDGGAVGTEFRQLVSQMENYHP